MEMTPEIIERIVRLVIEELARQGLLGGSCTGSRGTDSGTETQVHTLGKGKSRPVITEETVKDAWRAGHRNLRYPGGAVVTPSARDFAKDKKLEFLPLS